MDPKGLLILLHCTDSQPMLSSESSPDTQAGAALAGLSEGSRGRRALLDLLFCLPQLLLHPKSSGDSRSGGSGKSKERMLF